MAITTKDLGNWITYGPSGHPISNMQGTPEKPSLSVLCDELKKNTVYDDIIEAAGELGDKTLLPVLDTMLYKFDDNEIITSAIDKLKRS